MLNKPKISQILLTILIFTAISFALQAGAIAYQGVSGMLGLGLSSTQTQ